MSEKIVQRNEEAIKGGFGNRRAAALPERHCNRNPTISSAAPPWHELPVCYPDIVQQMGSRAI